MGLTYESDSCPFAELRNDASGELGAPYEAMATNDLQQDRFWLAKHDSQQAGPGYAVSNLHTNG
jgi:hypothetical protein